MKRNLSILLTVLFSVMLFSEAQAGERNWDKEKGAGTYSSSTTRPNGKTASRAGTVTTTNPEGKTNTFTRSVTLD